MNWGSHAASLIVLFFLSPYVVGKLDPASYGIWSLLNVLTGYMGLFDVGVRASVGRHIALYLGRGDQKGVDETIRAGLGFFSVVGCLMLAVGVALGAFFPHLFREVPVDSHGLVQVLLPIMAVNVWLSAVAAIYSSVLTARDRFDLTRGVDVVVLAARTVGTIVALEADTGLWGLAAAVILSNLLAVGGNYILARRQEVGLRSWPFLYNRQRLREIVGYGVAAFLTRASLKVIGQTDLVIVAALMSVASVREYNVGATVVYYTGTFIGIIESTFFPAIQRAAGRSDTESTQWIFFRQMRLALLFGVPLFVGMAMYAKPFIRLWMLQPGFDETSVLMSAGVMAILATAKLPLAFVGGAASLLAATGNIRKSAALTVIEAGVNVGLSLLFTLGFGWGLYGIAASTLVATLTVRALWLPVLAARQVGVPLQSLLTGLVLPAVVAAALFAGLCWLLLRAFPPAGWVGFFGSVAGALGCYSIIGGATLLPAEQRRSLLCRTRGFLDGAA